MPVNDYIKIGNEPAAIHAAKLRSGIRQLRQAYYEMIFIRRMMEHMTDEVDFSLIETLYGLETGNGARVYALVNNAVGNGAKNLTEQVG